MSAQIIEKNGKPEWAIIPYAEYQKLLETLETLDDVRAFDEAMNSQEELLPAKMVRRIVEGGNPIRIWREHRDMSQAELARAAGITPPYLSQLESGARKGSTRALRSLARALQTDIDDIV
jgi:Predicted transcriptional regulator